MAISNSHILAAISELKKDMYRLDDQRREDLATVRKDDLGAIVKHLETLNGKTGRHSTDITRLKVMAGIAAAFATTALGIAVQKLFG